MSLLWLLGLGVVIFFVVMALMSPFEAMVWWAGWSNREVDLVLPAQKPTVVPEIKVDAERYLVYLTGINGFAGNFLGRREMNFLEAVSDRVPDLVIVHDVFPFSATNNPLNGDRMLAALWQWIHNLRLKRPGTIFKNIISVRNILQVAVSADPRYGPLNNVGVANEVLESLLRQGYVPGSGKPIYLLGVSGGGQVALGTSTYIQRTLQAPVYLISMAGVLGDDPAVASLTHLYHFQGSKDRVPWVGAVLYPGRWPIIPHSAWNQARREGRITFINPGPMTHMGGGSYFTGSRKLPNGETYLDHVSDLVAEIMLKPADDPLLTVQ